MPPAPPEAKVSVAAMVGAVHDVPPPWGQALPAEQPAGILGTMSAAGAWC